jgi:hypothetical protein
MKRRYSIWVRESGHPVYTPRGDLDTTGQHEVELVQVDSNPNPIAWALEQKREHGINKYSSVRIVDNGEAAP